MALTHGGALVDGFSAICIFAEFGRTSAAARRFVHGTRRGSLLSAYHHEVLMAFRKLSYSTPKEYSNSCPGSPVSCFCTAALLFL